MVLQLGLGSGSGTCVVDGIATIRQLEDTKAFFDLGTGICNMAGGRRVGGWYEAPVEKHRNRRIMLILQK